MASVQVSGTDSVVAALRAATADAHAEIDRKLGLSADMLTRARYGVFLRASIAVVAPLEARIACWLGVPPDGFCRTSALRADLKALGEQDAEPASVPSIRSLAEAMGAAYVVEGSAIGGALLAKSVVRSLGEDAPRRYVALRGDKARRRGFVAALERWGAHAPAHGRIVACDSARATFAAYASAFAAAGAFR
jgi:heme oxygenase